MVDSEISERGWQRKVTMGGGGRKRYIWGSGQKKVSMLHKTFLLLFWFFFNFFFLQNCK